MIICWLMKSPFYAVKYSSVTDRELNQRLINYLATTTFEFSEGVFYLFFGGMDGLYQ